MERFTVLVGVLVWSGGGVDGEFHGQFYSMRRCRPPQGRVWGTSTRY